MIDAMQNEAAILGAVEAQQAAESGEQPVAAGPAQAAEGDAEEAVKAEDGGAAEADDEV